MKKPIIGGWNYRVGIKDKLYSIIEVYYDEKGIPNGYAERNPVANWEDYKDLKDTLKLVEQAIHRPIIDIDNFPKEVV